MHVICGARIRAAAARHGSACPAGFDPCLTYIFICIRIDLYLPVIVIALAGVLGHRRARRGTRMRRRAEAPGAAATTPTTTAMRATETTQVTEAAGAGRHGAARTTTLRTPMCVHVARGRDVSNEGVRPLLIDAWAPRRGAVVRGVHAARVQEVAGECSHGAAVVPHARAPATMCTRACRLGRVLAAHELTGRVWRACHCTIRRAGKARPV